MKAAKIAVGIYCLAALLMVALIVAYARTSPKNDGQLAALERTAAVVHDTIEHYTTQFYRDTVRLRVASAHADTVRDTVYAILVRVDSVARADSVVPASLAHAAVLACSDAILSDSVALAAARAALSDCAKRGEAQDTAIKLAERKAVVIETAAEHQVWAGRRLGFVVGMASTLFALRILRP